MIGESALRLIFWSVVFSALLTSPAYAYLDPGTASMLLQGLLGGIAAFFAVGSMYWKKPETTRHGPFQEKAAHEVTLINVAGSYRDPAGRVYVADGRILRTVAPIASAQYEHIRDTGILSQVISEGYVVGTQELPRNDWPAGLSSAAYVLEHERVPYVSYPYEWSFSQLKAAALLHLDLQLNLFERGAVLTDASAYNVQFIGSRPVFIDVLSIVPYMPGQYWTAHRQFCEQFLNPLLLRALKGVPHNAWFRGSLEGIQTVDLASLLSFWNKLSWRVLTQVTLPAQLHRQALRNPKAAVGRVRGQRKFPEAGYRGFLTQLRGWIASLRPRSGDDTVWQEYAVANTYEQQEAAEKREVVQSFVSKIFPQTLLDLGCNTGDYSIAALQAGAGRVVGFDFDNNAIDKAFERSKAEQLPFLPLLLDAANPSPQQGWMQHERSGFGERAEADAVIALAFEHHLAIGKNIPLDQVVDWIVKMAPVGLVEFVEKSDETVGRMLALREDIFTSYHREAFEAALTSRAVITAKTLVSSGGRTIYEFARNSK
ncbi:MAG: 50S ribosomal protein L11 methyltransferase [Sphingomonadaceae bacterium]|nr:50S ribosomal protein L11 methyltransferase [Sphingomonadaceae bacterium]